MDQTTKAIIEILKRPAEYSVERVSRALAEILEITGEYCMAAGPAGTIFTFGDQTNG